MGLAKIMTSSFSPFLSLAESSILPISHYFNQWEELMKKWERQRGRRGRGAEGEGKVKVS